MGALFLVGVPFVGGSTGFEAAGFDRGLERTGTSVLTFEDVASAFFAGCGLLALLSLEDAK